MASTVGLIPWKPGESGNPNGSSTKRRFQAAVRRALTRVMRAGDVDELDVLADEVVALATQRDKHAVRMLLECWAREDGPLEHRLAVNDGGPLVIFQPLTLQGVDPERMRNPAGNGSNGNGHT